MIWSETNTGKAIGVNVPDQVTLLDDIARRFEARQGFSVATLNLDHVVKLARDPDFRVAYGAHTHITADGNPIVWLSRLAGQSDVRLVPGSELVDPVVALASTKGVPVALFGTTDAALSDAATALEANHPRLEIVLKLSPPMGFDPEGADAEAAIETIKTSGARLVFVCVSAPKQEIFVAKAQRHLPEVGFLSVGAGLDFIAGRQNRAPVWAQKLAMEWLWRLLGNPRRFAARYGACIMVLPKMTLRALSSRLRREPL